MRLSEILKRFTLISGLDEDEALKWVFICSDAQEFLFEELLDKNPSEADIKKLEKAAGYYAFYKYSELLYCLEDEVESFKAGDLQINQKSRDFKRAYTLWLEERKSIEALLKPSQNSSFCFFVI